MASGREDSAGKADFNAVYNEPDPRGYFQTLGEWDYEIPSHGVRIFNALLEARHKLMEVDPGRPPRVLDLCCSYGVNAALLKCDLTLDDLYAHYGSEGLADASSDEVVEGDREFFARHRHRSTRPPPPTVVGLDVADQAIAYATRTGLLDSGWSLDLEREDPPDAFRAAVADTDLVTVTGGIGYITARTFRRVLDCIRDEARPWIASLVLRMYDYSDVVEAFADAGLVTEELEGVTFPQRRFATEEEADFALARLAERGVDPTGREADGVYHTTLLVSRPPEHVEAWPLDELLENMQAE